jgi:hypothetical protein
MNDQLFFEVVLSSQLSNGIVKIEVASLAGQDKDGKQAITPPKTILTSITGLVQMQAQLNRFVDELVDKKILKKNDKAPTANGKDAFIDAPKK